MKNVINCYFKVEIKSKNRADFISKNKNIEEKIRTQLEHLGRITDFRLSQTNLVDCHIVWDFKKEII